MISATILKKDASMTSSIGHHLQREAITSGITNALINGLIAWLLLRGGPALGWSGRSSFVVDLFATAFILPFIVALIVIPLQRAAQRKGKLPALTLKGDSLLAAMVRRLPRSLALCALGFGLLGALVFAPVALVLLASAGVTSINPLPYAMFKGLWAGAVAAVLVIPMIIYALEGAERPTVKV